MAVTTLDGALDAINASLQMRQDLINDGYDLNSLDDFIGLNQQTIASRIEVHPNWNGAQAGRLAGKIKPEPGNYFNK